MLDAAAVNVNIWITPDDANLDPASGGLVVYTAKPPAGMDFAAWNQDTGRVVDELLAPTGFANVTVPHKANRAVLFDSALFHTTDALDFVRGGGPEKRRINLTLLYGHMQRPSAEEPECISRPAAPPGGGTGSGGPAKSSGVSG